MSGPGDSKKKGKGPPPAADRIMIRTDAGDRYYYPTPSDAVEAVLAAFVTYLEPQVDTVGKSWPARFVATLPKRLIGGQSVTGSESFDTFAEAVRAVHEACLKAGLPTGLPARSWPRKQKPAPNTMSGRGPKPRRPAEPPIEGGTITTADSEVDVSAGAAKAEGRRKPRPP